jgi:hypothetical protein
MTADLWRLMVLAAFVMVMVIAFAATVKPLAEGTLDPANALRFMLYAMPPMLAYALPFAAGFGATLVYHRMATDNEALAAHAGGVSHRAFMAPAFFTAAVLTVGGLFMHDQIIPEFLHRMQRMITVDLSRLVASEVARGNAIKQKNLLIFADQGKSFGPDRPPVRLIAWCSADSPRSNLIATATRRPKRPPTRRRCGCFPPTRPMPSLDRPAPYPAW